MQSPGQYALPADRVPRPQRACNEQAPVLLLAGCGSPSPPRGSNSGFCPGGLAPAPLSGRDVWG